MISMTSLGEGNTKYIKELTKKQNIESTSATKPLLCQLDEWEACKYSWLESATLSSAQRLLSVSYLGNCTHQNHSSVRRERRQLNIRRLLICLLVIREMSGDKGKYLSQEHCTALACFSNFWILKLLFQNFRSLDLYVGVEMGFYESCLCHVNERTFDKKIVSN